MQKQTIFIKNQKIVLLFLIHYSLFFEKCKFISSGSNCFFKFTFKTGKREFMCIKIQETKNKKVHTCLFIKAYLKNRTVSFIQKLT